MYLQFCIILIVFSSYKMIDDILQKHKLTVAEAHYKILFIFLVKSNHDW